MNKIIILALVFSGLTGVGILGNTFLIDIQPLGLFSNLDELEGSICSCTDAEGNFSPENCEQFGGDYSDNTQGTCLELASITEYGDPPLQTQGCSADFWQITESSTGIQTVWPAGYSPNYYFNEIFQVTITVPDEDDAVVINDVTETNIESLENEIVNASGVTDEIQLDPVGNATSTDPVGNATSTEPDVVEDEVDTGIVEDNNNSNQNMGIDLAGALELEGTQLNDLLRESVSAMLNAAHSDINYPYSVPEIITMTQIALANEDYDETVQILKEANNRGNTSICNA